MTSGDQEYEMELQRTKWMKRAEFAFVQVLRVIWYFVKLMIQLVWGILKTLLQTFGIPVR